MSWRGDNIVFGTTTTGTGTLTLANITGGTDPVQWLGTSGVVNTFPYTLIEYTDATYATPSKIEIGYGTLTLAGTIGATTLTRNPIKTDVSHSVTVNSPTAVTIGTAANVLIFQGASAISTPSSLLFYDTAGDNTGVPWSTYSAGGNSASNFTLTTAQAVFVPLEIKWSRVVTTAYVRVGTAAGAGANTFNIALFEVGTGGKPGRRLINFGDACQGGAGDLTNATTLIHTTALGTGVLITPGFYVGGFVASFTGAPTIRGLSGVTTAAHTGMFGTTSHQPNVFATVASGDVADPPTTTGWTVSSTATVTPYVTFK